ncbi:MAG: fasciclin domain-containing protein, partial [Pseudomonadota bacterium]
MPSVLATVAADADYSILVSLVQYVDATLDVGLADALDDEDLNATLFAPTNAALIQAAISLGYPEDDAAGATDYLIAAADALTDGAGAAFLAEVLTFHVAPGALGVSDLEDGDTIPTLLGVDLTVT